jgi:hypothetical protein
MDKHPCQMDADGGVIRSIYKLRKCCGTPTQHYFVHDGKKYYLCAGHMATSGLFAMGYCLDDCGNRVEPIW